MNATVAAAFFAIGLFSLLMSAVTRHWVDEARLIAHDNTATYRERIDAALSVPTLGLEFIALFGFAVIGLTVGTLVLVGFIPTGGQ